MNDFERLTKELICAYRLLSSKEENIPNFTVRKKNRNEIVIPTIPFIGKRYSEQSTKILVYASTENLTDYYDEINGYWLDDDTLAENRHRVYFDNSEIQKNSFFPFVHCSPMNNGALLTAVYYCLLSNICKKEYESPYEFYETIAFGNYGKFALETEYQKNVRLNDSSEGSKENVDYTRLPVKEARDKLKYSIPFLEQDIKILKPDILILPKTVYEINRNDFDKISSGIRSLKFYQMNVGVINRTISRKYLPHKAETLPKTVYSWYKHLLNGGMTDRYLSVFTYLDTLNHI